MNFSIAVYADDIANLSNRLIGKMLLNKILQY